MTYHKPRYRFLYLAVLLLSLQYAFTLYINSSFLLQHFSKDTVDTLYMVGAAVTIVFLLGSGRLLRRFGNWKLMLTGIGLEILALCTLAFSTDPELIKIAFIAHQALPPLLIFSLDIFFEGILLGPDDAEKVRSYYLTFMNTAFVLAPATVGFLSSFGSFKPVYAVSVVFLLLLWLLIFDIFKTIHPRRYRDTEIIPCIKKFLRRKALTDIFFLNFLLQCFYAIMVIFMAPHLHETIGLSWGAIGLIFTIMLLPFVIFEAPLGKLFDRFHDEKDVLIAGFIIMSVSISAMAFVHSASILLWAALLFVSRIGASFVEVASEAAFYKRVTDQDAGLISIFRLSVPTSYIVAPFIATLVVPALPVTVLFILVGLALVVGVSAAYSMPV